MWEKQAGEVWLKNDNSSPYTTAVTLQYNSKTAHSACCCCNRPNKDLINEFKLLLLVYKSLNGLEPKSISDCLLPYEPSWPPGLSGRVAANCSKSAN